MLSKCVLPGVQVRAELESFSALNHLGQVFLKIVTPMLVGLYSEIVLKELKELRIYCRPVEPNLLA